MSRLLPANAICPAVVATIVLAFAAPLAADRALTPKDFVQTGEQGFGDRQNSWPWSMRWWKGHLYVGTYRSFPCISQRMLQVATNPFVFPYPPPNPNVECAPTPEDIPMAAEIWRWTPESDFWERVFQSPVELANPDVPGKLLPYELGIRTSAVHTDAGGVEALYFGCVSTQPMWFGSLPPPRILRTVDGVNFEAVPQTPGSFLGDLSDASHRSFTEFNGRLFGLTGSVQGNGALIFSDDPKLGDDAWRLAAPEDVRFFEMAVFNGQLYLGVFERGSGYGVVRTPAQGEPPFEFETVIEPGAFLTPVPSDYVLSMYVFQDRLFVGTASYGVPSKPTELVRIAPDDTWELVMGMPRLTPNGLKYPATGIGDGFANGFNDHVWRMHAYDGRLYVATWDSSTEWAHIGTVGALTETMRGFDLFWTEDGWYFHPITNNGLGDGFNEGIRGYADTPFGLFLGSINDSMGLRIFRANASTPSLPEPRRVEVEPIQSRPLLHWRPSPGATGYRVFRSQLGTAPELPNILGTPVVQGPFVEIAQPKLPLYFDLSAQIGQSYLYRIVATAPGSDISGFSNLVQFPSETPPVQFSTLSNVVDKLEARGLISAVDADDLRTRYAQARDLAATGSHAQSVATLHAIRAELAGTALVMAPDNRDLEILTDKAARRVALNLLSPQDAGLREAITVGL